MEELNQQSNQELYGKWKVEFDEKLQEFINNSDATYEELIELIWENGILDHFAPTDLVIINARKELGRKTFDRNDPEFYKILKTDIEGLLDSVSNGKTMYSTYGSEIVSVGVTIMMNRPKILNDKKKEDDKNAFVTLIKSILEKIEEKL